jgi:hypothetical protein
MRRSSAPTTTGTALDDLPFLTPSSYPDQGVRDVGTPRFDTFAGR